MQFSSFRRLLKANLPPEPVFGIRTMAGIVARDWEATWAAGLKKGQGWDISTHHSILEKLEREGTLPKGRALVPGCGRGYDVGFLAAADRFTIGVEYSATAATVAKDYLAAEYPSKKDFYEIKSGDFFYLDEEDGYDLIYDYTFFCALPPSSRAAWGAKMAKLLKRGGCLVSLEFPLKPYPEGELEDFTRGPPFQLKHEFYEEALHPHGVRCYHREEIDPSLSDPRRAGMEALALWRHSD